MSPGSLSVVSLSASRIGLKHQRRILGKQSFLFLIEPTILDFSYLISLQQAVFLSQLLHKLFSGMVSGSVNGDIATKAVLEAAQAVAGQHFLLAKEIFPAQSFKKGNKIIPLQPWQRL